MRRSGTWELRVGGGILMRDKNENGPVFVAFKL